MNRDEPLDTDALLAVYNAARADARSSNTDGPGWEPATPMVDWTEAYGGGTDDGARWLTEPLIPEGGAVALFAKGGTGKSLLSLWIAAGIATGTGLTGELEPAEVLYLDYEMRVSDVVERLFDMGYSDPTELHRLHYAALPTLPPLDTEAGGRAVLELAHHYKVSLVVVDTFGRAVDGEEDRADTVRAWYRWTGQLLKSAGVAFVRVDHAGKESKRGQRGSSAKNDDVDVVWEMTDRGRGSYLLTPTKRRHSWIPDKVALEQTEENGVLSYTWTDHRTTYLAGTREVADLLETLGAELTYSNRQAMDLLRNAGHGKRSELVADALRHRREQSGYTYRIHPGRGYEVVSGDTDTDTANLQVDTREIHPDTPSDPKPVSPHTPVRVWGTEGGAGLEEEPVLGLFEDYPNEEDE